MELKEFKKQAKKEEIHTCNAWGFDGYYGNKYTYGKYQMIVAHWGYRHATPTPYNTFSYNGISIDKKEFVSKISKLQVN